MHCASAAALAPAARALQQSRLPHDLLHEHICHCGRTCDPLSRQPIPLVSFPAMCRATVVVVCGLTRGEASWPSVVVQKHAEEACTHLASELTQLCPPAGQDSDGEEEVEQGAGLTGERAERPGTMDDDMAHSNFLPPFANDANKKTSRRVQVRAACAAWTRVLQAFPPSACDATATTVMVPHLHSRIHTACAL